MQQQKMQYVITDSRITCLVVLVAALLRYAHSCFPMEDLFLQHRVWTQQTSLYSHNVIKVGVEQEDLMTVDSFQHGAKTTAEYRCQIAYGENRYLVRMDSPGMDDSIFQCIQFNVLTPYVIRMGKTDRSYIRKKVNCADDTYTEEESVLVADVSHFTHPCPLSGGYQLIMHAGMAVTSTCPDSIQTYNPRIQFQCDGSRSGNVLIELGDSCELTALTSRVKILKRNLAYFRCFGSWQENQFSSVLLQMQENPRQLWCLHYKKYSYKSADFLQMFIAVDGRCSSGAFSNEAVPRNTSIFGFMAKYTPAKDFKCQDQSHIEKCSSAASNCYNSDSLDCPEDCGRCNKEIVFRNCSFDPATQGVWRDISSSPPSFEVNVENDRISGELGEFRIAGTQGESQCHESSYHGFLYRLVQIGSEPSCMPYYACARLIPRAPGMLVFQLQPAARDPKTGEPLSCEESSTQWGHITPTPAEHATALFDLSKLSKTRCEQPHQATFSTVQGQCRILLKPCVGDCTVLYAGYDPVTCGNETGQARKLENHHTCYGTLHFDDGVLGIVTKSATGRYFCWLFTGARLFIARAERCHQVSVSHLLIDTNAAYDFDPLNAVAVPLVDSDSVGLKLSPLHPTHFIIVYLLIYIFKQL
ncbi:unnamed protein product [Lymnaea stagnalis]|uniref:Uncharacterized protein n=1 Tax=Lymnaea stagnalis TaxID=6523 RepID=A0AAV2HYN6_LYMST